MKGYRPTKPMLLMSGLGTSIGLVVLIKEFAGGCQYNSKERLDDKMIIITGGNRGIGKEVTRNLATKGGNIIIGCRNMEECGKTRKELILETKNKKISCRHLDLGSINSIREFAASFKTDQKKLDLLINNAGIYLDSKERKLTIDGFESQLGINHFGHFLLTNLLWEKLKLSNSGRIVNVSSVAHIRGDMDFDNLNWEKNYDSRNAYARSKLANILFTKHLAKKMKEDKIVVCAVHPGMVKTDLYRDMSFKTSWISYCLLNPLLTLVLKTPCRGAQPVIHCALSPDIRSGHYYSNCKEQIPSELARDEEAAEFLWRTSTKWTKLKEQAQG